MATGKRLQEISSFNRSWESYLITGLLCIIEIFVLLRYWCYWSLMSMEDLGLKTETEISRLMVYTTLQK